MAVSVVVIAEEWPVTLAEAKAHLRVDHADDDLLIDALIKAATVHAENFTGRSFTYRTLDYSFDEFPADGGWIEIPKPPLVEVVGVFQGDTEFEAFEIAYGGENTPGRIKTTSSWPTGMGRIRYRAGYVDPASAIAQVPHSDETLLSDDTGYALASLSSSQAWVPPPIKAAILMHIGALYRNREEVQPNQTYLVPWGAEALLRQYNVERSLA